MNLSGSLHQAPVFLLFSPAKLHFVLFSNSDRPACYKPFILKFCFWAPNKPETRQESVLEILVAIVDDCKKLISKYYVEMEAFWLIQLSYRARILKVLNGNGENHSSASVNNCIIYPIHNVLYILFVF